MFTFEYDYHSAPLLTRKLSLPTKICGQSVWKQHSGSTIKSGEASLEDEEGRNYRAL